MKRIVDEKKLSILQPTNYNQPTNHFQPTIIVLASQRAEISEDKASFAGKFPRGPRLLPVGINVFESILRKYICSPFVDSGDFQTCDGYESFD